MIDGFKISKLINARELERLTAVVCLDFCQKINISTGEFENNSPVEAKYKGLTIRLVSEFNGVNSRLIVRGSLHKFYNDGGTNGNDFYLWQIHEALLKLEALLTIPLKGFKLENIEFGVNLETELTAAKYIRSLIYDGNKAFANLDVNDNYIGKQCARQDTTLKIYDKGKQEKNGNKRLLRIELKFNRMRLLVDPSGRYRVSEIIDLLNPGRIGVVGQELAARWSQIVFYDGGIDETKLTPAQSARLWKYRSPQFWEEINRNQRYKARQSFDKLIAEKSTRQTQAEIEKMILLKWQKLINTKHKKRRQLTRFLYEGEAPKTATNDTLQYRRQMSPKKNQSEKQKKKVVEKRFCSVCGKDISTRKSTALTCSRKCRNKKSNQARTAIKAYNRNQEEKQLKRVVEKLNNEIIKVSILKLNKKRFRTINTHEIKPMTYKEIRKIICVRGSCGGVSFEFTTMRAKEFIKQCIIINSGNNEQKRI